MEVSGDRKWITLIGPDYGQRVEIHNDDVVEDQEPLARRILDFLNRSLARQEDTDMTNQPKEER
jgi:hypothetical protein